MASEAEAEAARAWLRAQGFDVRVEQRDMSDELRRRGLGGVDTLRHTHAVVRAQRRYVQEQT